jgi:16S rRNA processing protein RimM
MKKDLFPIGCVVKPHGVRGKIKVQYFGEDIGQFSRYRSVFIEDPDGVLRPYEIGEVTPQPPRLILQLKGFQTVEDIQPLLGKEILVRKESLPSLPEGEYYWMDLLGMDVVTEDGKNIGKVIRIFPTGANDVYVVQGKRREIFLPATERVIRRIDCLEKVMEVGWMEGLWEREDEI